VVNEAVDPKTGSLRSNVFTERMGALEQIDLSFRLAPSARRRRSWFTTITCARIGAAPGIALAC
jgi:GH35 family endo-1,4-beta-xylanase